MTQLLSSWRLSWQRSRRLPVAALLPLVVTFPVVAYVSAVSMLLANPASLVRA